MMYIHGGDEGLQLPANNVFAIHDPQAYACLVEFYQIGHSLLLIRADRSKQIGPAEFYLTFEDVQYFEGPVRWEGAEFGIGERDECFELLDRVWFCGGILRDQLIERFLLFKVRTRKSEIKIVARNALKSQDIPPNFVWANT